MSSGEMIGIASLFINLVMGVIGYLIKKQIESVEKQRDELKRDVDAIGGKLSGFQLEVAKQYISFDRLSEVMAPFKESLDRLEHAQRDLVQRLDAKADKA